MNKLNTIVFALAGVSSFATASLAADCKPAHTFPTVASGKLTVAVYEYPPFTTGTSGGDIGGIDSEIARKIAAENCLAVVPVVVDPAAAIQYVLTSKADVSGGDWYRTQLRAKVLDISAPTYLDQMGIYSKDGVDTVQSLIDKQVGTVSGFNWVPELQKLLGTNLRLYPSPVALAQDLAAGRIDVGVDSYATGVYAQKKGGYQGIKILVSKPDSRVQSSIEPAQSGLLYTKGNKELGVAIDDGIAKMRADGTIANLLKENGLDPSGADVGAPRIME